MKITLLIITYNWKEALSLVLKSVLEQTKLPDEIVIGDDGSRPDTQKVIDSFRTLIPVPIIHVWQEDLGFRKAMILNKSIAKSSGDYIIQIDGDIIMEKHFIEDHLDIIEKGYYVCGSRVKTERQEAERLLREQTTRISFRGIKLSFLLNRLRSRLLRHFLTIRYARKIDHMRGCNCAYWREDAISVNGYNEDLTEWGHEDSEFIYRLHFRGIKKKTLKMGGIAYHIWHNEASRHNEATHLAMIETTIREKLNLCKNGINKYLK